MPRATQEPPGGRERRRKGLSPAAADPSRPFRRRLPPPTKGGPTTPGARRHAPGLGCSPFARRYWGNHSCFLLLPVLRCFSSGGSPPPRKRRAARLPRAGFSRSGTPGSKAICASPGIFAACRALRRLGEPRHPPCALSHLRAPSALAGGAASRAWRAMPLRPGAARRAPRFSFPYRRRRGLPRAAPLYFVQHAIDRSRYQRDVENNGFEPLTPCLQSRCSSQLS